MSLRRAVGWAAVALLCAGAAPDPRLAEAQAAFAEATKLQDAGQYAEALPHAERALALREAALGDSHLEVASCLHLLGGLHRLLGSFARAEPLLQRALAIREAALGKDHPDVAASLHTLGALSWVQGQYERAEALYQRAIAIQEVALGKDHLDFAKSLNNLGVLCWTRGQYERAERLLQRALAIREAKLGQEHPAVAKTVNNLGLLYLEQGAYDQAEAMFRRSLAIQEATLGPNHPEVALSLNNLGMVLYEQGQYGRAEPPYQRALAIREAALGKDHPDVAMVLNNLANLYRTRGQYGRAEPLLERALQIKEATLGKDHPDLVAPLINLGNLYKSQGFLSRTEPLYERALELAEATFGKVHPDVSTALDNLATLYVARGQYSRAEPLYLRALQIKQAVFGSNHPTVAEELSNLAGLYASQGSYDRAEPLYRRALAIQEAVLGESHPDLNGPLQGLARIFMDLGRYDRAAPLLERALAIQEAALGKSHPALTESLGSLARLRIAQHRRADALSLLSNAMTLSEERLRREALDFSEARLGNFLELLRAEEEGLYALLRAHPEDARVRQLALATALLRKGRSIDEIANTSRTVYRSLGAEDRETFERLRGLRTQLAALSIAGPGKLSAAEYPQRLKELAAQGDALEADLARRSAPLRTLTALPGPGQIVDRVAASLPRDGALVELIAYEDRPLVPRRGTLQARRPGALRYLALVLFPDGRTGARDLGPAAPIDRAASRLWGVLSRGEVSVREAAEGLHRLAFQPLMPLLGKVRRLYLAPDGQLGLIPFAALHDGRRFLVDTLDITYLTSGRDLLPGPEGIPPGRSVIVLADPDFEAAPQAHPTERAYPVERFFSSFRGELADHPWPPLPGTRQEAEAIQRLLPQAEIFLGADASKERLLRLEAPGILHIATHGFFLEDAPVPAGARAVGHFGAAGEGPPALRPDDPLLRSGLVLSGARAGGPGGGKRRLDESLVTALELSGLDLWGTELVVLSACDTARGEVKLGQGVYGLRRALVVAGAETVVMSLWKVKDETTRAFMEAYYRSLLAGKGRAAALREAMLTLRQTEPHPHAWAPFIALGRDAPLRLGRP